MGPPLEPFPAAPASPGIELTVVSANDDNNDDDNNNNNNNNDNAGDTLRDTDTETAAPVLPSLPRTYVTVGRERRESVAGSAASDSLPRRLSKSFQESDLPRGFLAATADVTSTLMTTVARSRSSTRTRSSTVSDPEERNKALQQQRTPSKGGDGTVLATLDEQARAASMDIPQRAGGSKDGDRYLVTEAAVRPATSAAGTDAGDTARASSSSNKNVAGASSVPAADAALYSAYDNGYHFPPRYSNKEALQHGAHAFWHYLRTPVGFVVVVYGLNIVAWGGMLFLLLCQASPAMCHPSCSDINSPRRVWIETDSQILNALFCVTGFGLAPWRFRDMYFYLQWRVRKQEKGLRRLAGVHRDWLRLPGSQDLPVTTGPGSVPPETPCSAIPFPESKIPDRPLTGQRAPPTRPWVIAFVLCMNLANTFLQAVLCGFMWGMNRYDRPSWSTGLFVALGCLAGAFGGLGMFVEGKRVKGIEGVPLTDEDRARLASDRARGIYHYNNLSGKRPKEKTADPEAQK